MCKLVPTFCHFVKPVIGNNWNNIVQTVIFDEPKRSVRQVRSVTHRMVHISLVVDSAILMQQKAQPLTGCNSLLPFTPYKKSFLLCIEHNESINQT